LCKNVEEVFGFALLEGSLDGEWQWQAGCGSFCSRLTSP
jgi:hypothetical protein